MDIWKNLSKKGKIAAAVAAVVVIYLACNWVGWI
jgi:flagellar biosynthesis/type III secretory pathway M-ring protein FliF/YscJ